MKVSSGKHSHQHFVLLSSRLQEMFFFAADDVNCVGEASHMDPSLPQLLHCHGWSASLLSDLLAVISLSVPMGMYKARSTRFFR